MNEFTLDKSVALTSKSLHLSRIKLFGLYIHSQFLLLLIVEILISVVTVYAGGIYLELGLTSFKFDSMTYFKIVSVPLVLSLSMAGVGLYSSRQPRDALGIFLRFGVAAVLSALAIAMLYSIFPSMIVSVQRLFLLMVASLVGLAIIRFCFYRLLNQSMFERRVLVMGTGERAAAISSLHDSDDPTGFDLIGYIEPVNSAVTKVGADKVLSGNGSLFDMVTANRINEVVIALDDRRQQLPSKELLECKLTGVAIVDVLDFLERESGKINFDLLHPSWLIYANGFNKYFFSDFFKRSFDVICSLILLIISAPVFIVTALAIWLESRGKDPIFYYQNRVGQQDKIFQILKFRSMRTDAEKDGTPQWAEEQDPRVTSVGNIIRKYRIDELPQLLNVLFGHMSLVGPRPERPEIVRNLKELNTYYSHRHRVKPGLTGWAQLRFKYGATEANAIEKLQYDIYYLKNYSILFDLYILIQTVEVVLFRKGAR